MLNEGAAERKTRQEGHPRFAERGACWDLLAVSKMGYLLVTEIGPYVSAVKHANSTQGIAPGLKIDFDQLPNKNEDEKAFDEKVASLMRAGRMVWALGAKLDGETLVVNMEDQKSAEITPLFPNLDNVDQRFKKGKALERAEA